MKKKIKDWLKNWKLGVSITHDKQLTTFAFLPVIVIGKDKIDKYYYLMFCLLVFEIHIEYNYG